MADMTTKFALIPPTWDADRAAETINAVSKNNIGVPVFFDTPDEALAANIAAGYNQKGVVLKYVQVTFRVIETTTAPVSATAN